MLDHKILKLLLNVDFYNDCKDQLNSTLFENEAKDVYEVICKHHEDFGESTNLAEVKLLWRTFNPTATTAEESLVHNFINKIEESEEISENVARTIIDGLWSRRFGQKVANLGIEIADGDDTARTRLDALLQSAEVGFRPDEFDDPVTDDLDELLDETSDENRFKFNIPSLSEKVYGIGRQEFGIFFARPETGKTAFWISLVAAPNGFYEQGLKTAILVNEEKGSRTKFRLLQAYLGKTPDEIRKDKPGSSEALQALSERCVVMNIQGWDTERIETFCKSRDFDVVVIDQADKVGLKERYDSGHEKLRALYTELREICKRLDSAVLAISQASDAASGKARLDINMMEGSKTGKAAEADLIIGIGKKQAGDMEDEDVQRHLTACKNKISGWHGMVICQIKPELSRYVV